MPAHARIRALLVLCLLSAAAPLAAQNPLYMRTLFSTWTGVSNPSPVMYTETRSNAANGSVRLVITVQRQGNPAPPPPYTLRAELPPGFVNVRQLALPAGASCAPFTGGGSDPMVIECVLTTQVTGTAQVLQLGLDTGTAAQFGATQATSKVTLDYAAFPLPEDPDCVAINGNTGCVVTTSTVYPSSIRLNSLSVSGGNLTFGQDGMIRVNHQVTGFDSNYQNEIAIDLPEGLQFRGSQHIVAPTAMVCSAAPRGAGERVTCTYPMYSTAGNGGPNTSYFNLIVRPVAPLTLPGPVQVVASVGNEARPRPEDCELDPERPNCAVLDVGLVPMPAPRMVFTATEAPVPYILLDEDESLRVEYRNAGDAQAAQVRVAASLPPGFAYVGAGSSASSNTCSASGAVETGQRVVCVQNSMPANSTSRRLDLVIRGDRALAPREGNVALFAVGTGAVADDDLLLACAADPEREDCARLVFDAGIACDSDPVQAIYCDGYERR